MNENRRTFLAQAGAASFGLRILATPAFGGGWREPIESDRMRSGTAFTAETLSTDSAQTL